MSTKSNVKTFQGVVLALQESGESRAAPLCTQPDMEVERKGLCPNDCITRVRPLEPMAFCYDATFPSNPTDGRLAKTKPLTTLLPIPSGD